MDQEVTRERPNITLAPSSAQNQQRCQLLPQNRNILNRIDNDHEIVREEFARQRDRLSRKKTSLEEAKTTMKKEFFTFQTMLEELDITSQKYFCERSRLQRLTSSYVSLIVGKSNETKNHNTYSCSSGTSSTDKIHHHSGPSDPSFNTSYIIHEEEIS